MGVDRITRGPINTGGTDPLDSPGVLLLDQTTPTFEFTDQNQNRHAVQSRLLLLQAQTALTAITTAQTLLSKAFLAGALNVLGRTIRVKGSIIFNTTSTNSATVTIALKLGSVTLLTITTGATDAGADTNLQLEFDYIFSVQATGTTGKLESHGSLRAQLGATNAAGVTTYLDTNTAVSSSVDLTTALTLAATIAASAAVPSAQLRLATIEVLG